MGTKGGDEDGTEETVQSSSEELQSKHETKHTVKVKSSSLENRKVVKHDSLEQKRKEFSRVASFMGMDDLEFSKWLLAASPVQRSEVLQQYKRKRNRKCEHNQN
jgi:DNA excision repair protein ERCC-6-like 2